MTTGEKIAWFRKQKGMTQEQLSEKLLVSRQSVSRWEMDSAFPETDKLIQLSTLFGCSIDFLLKGDNPAAEKGEADQSADACCAFIRRCGHFFLATSVDNRPSLRPFGMIASDGRTLLFATDKRKRVYQELKKNDRIELGSYHPGTHQWMRVCGRAQEQLSERIKAKMLDAYPNLRRSYQDGQDPCLAIFSVKIENVYRT